MSAPGFQSAAFAELLRLVERRVGLTFPPPRQEAARTAIEQMMAQTGHENLSAYLRHLETSPSDFEDLVCELTVGETYFFRDPEQFEALRTEVLPALLNAKEPSDLIRAWSAGCASGEEPYSLAMLLREMGLAQRCSILATDVSHEALERARVGKYRKWSLRGGFSDWTRRYLTRSGNEYQLQADLKKQVWFAELNLAREGYPSARNGTSSVDLILCRNVLIYFDQGTVEQVAQRLFDCLTPGGWLVTGAADPPLWNLAPFETQATGGGIFYCRPLLETPSPELPAAPEPRLESPAAAARRKPKNRERPLPPLALQHAPPSPSVETVLEQANAAMNAGDYKRAASMLADDCDHSSACVLLIRALANVDLKAAEQSCQELSARHPTCAELHYLHALLLIDQSQWPDAVAAARRALFLDRSLIIVHLTLGTLFDQLGDSAAAIRSFQNAKGLCEKKPADEELPWTEGESIGGVLKIAEQHLIRLQATS